jgi:hypothetical protein
VLCLNCKVFLLRQLWDCQKMEGSNLVNRAHKMFPNQDRSPLTALSVCGTTELFAAAAESGLLSINRYVSTSVLKKNKS